MLPEDGVVTNNSGLEEHYSVRYEQWENSKKGFMQTRAIDTQEIVYKRNFNLVSLETTQSGKSVL